MGNILGKITAFITREGKGGTELLLIRHPHAGIQIPAGTIEEGEAPEAAAFREVFEETGLETVKLKAYIGFMETVHSEGTLAVIKKTTVFSGPDTSSFDWAHFRRGILVSLERSQGDFMQVTYEEGDNFPDPSYITYRITGWVPAGALADRTIRHFYHMTCDGCTEDHWERFADNDNFGLFWAPLSGLPEIVYPQSRWLGYVRDELKYGL